jgi:cell division protein FtsZ
MMLLGGGALMAIGHGNGENKAIKAVKQAINHPLLGTVSLENAAGVIANFTAGEDLSLVEISEALIFLQEQTNNSTEIVMGTTQNNHMNERVQVNLVITGLGSQTLEDVIPGFEKMKGAEPDPEPEAEEQVISKPAQKIPSDNLDIPAFLRRRTQLAG